MPRSREDTRKREILERVRGACLGLPETHEKEAWGAPTFRVRGRLFAMFVDNHHGDGRLAIWCSAPVGAQDALVFSAPRHFFVPPYVGPQGWVGVRLDTGLKWEAIATRIEEAHRIIAAKGPARARKINAAPRVRRSGHPRRRVSARRKRSGRR